MNDNELSDLRDAADNAIGAYIEAATGVPATDIDWSYLTEEINDTIRMLGGEPAPEPEY